MDAKTRRTTAARATSSSARLARRSMVVVGALSVLLGARRADAFCRTVTCQGTPASCPADADGCGTNGIQLFWKSTCLQFDIQSAGTKKVPMDLARPAIAKAFQAWSGVDCGAGKRSSLAFTAGPDVSCGVAQYNTKAPNVNVVFFTDSGWKYKGAVDADLAKTTVTFNVDTGEIYDADIDVNTADHNVTATDTQVGYDLESILTHEVGHFAGMAHSRDKTAVMFGTYESGSTTQRVLGADDVAGACAAYPPGRAGTCDAVPRGGFSGTCGDGSGGSRSSSGGCALSGISRSGGALPVAGLALVALASLLGRSRRR